MVDEVDAFDSSKALWDNHKINTDVELTVFAALHGIVCDGTLQDP